MLCGCTNPSDVGGGVLVFLADLLAEADALQQKWALLNIQLTSTGERRLQHPQFLGVSGMGILVYYRAWAALATILVATGRHGLRMIAVARQRVCLIATVSTFLVSSAILVLVSVDEYPLRKFFTYLVVPRLFTAWLAAACLALVIGSRLMSCRAA